jgi:hypothetical protein
MGLRLGLCDGHSNTSTLLSLNHFATTLEVCLGSLSIWKTHLQPSFNFQTDVLMLLQYIHMMPSILWTAPVPPAAKHPHSMMLPPPCVTVGIVFFGLQASPFSSKHNDGHLSKKYDLCPHVQLQTVVWLFYGGFGAVASSLLSSFSGCQYRTCFTVDIDTFVPVSSSIFTRSFAAVLGLIYTFCTKVRLSLGDRTRLSMTAAWSHGVYTCLLLFVQMNVVPSGIWKFHPRMNQTCDGLQLLFWGLGWFLLIFPWCEAKRHWVRVGLEIYPQAHLQLTQMMSISLAEASKAMT